MQNLALVIDALLSGVVVIDAGGTVREMNTAACRLLMTSAETARRRPVEQVLGRELSRYVRTVLAEGRGLVENEILLEPRVGDATGSGNRLVEIAVSPFRDAEERGDGVVLEIRDRSIQRELLDAESERHRMTSFGRIAAGIAHEVKNPLGGIRGAGELLARRSDDPRAKKTAELVMRETDRISALLDDFMELARDERLRPRAVNLHRVLDDVLDLHDLDPLSEGVEIVRLYDPSIPELMADRDRLAQIFHNLVRNALQAMNEGEPQGNARLEIRTRIDLALRLATGERSRGPAVEISIRDSGPGIPDDLRDRITEPFFTTRAAGTGLGLAIAQHWVAGHGGRLALEGEPGKGTRARVHLPLRTAGEPT